ncbi:hypothetical protein [Methylobacterium sp. WL120]|uniref:hypothetical protein n=1 Tax=Methylobacterium sp. WL120 TaxID=2603887 RepID=UPI0011C75A86|nr:hypothetical protein [Methylobacterium sp. WL120]TXM65843.1 hypothetical protein FV229_14310 [Methylobacterium sp. WL120]
MFAAVPTIRARFEMGLRCHNCHHMTKRMIESPDLEDAPTCVDELLVSAWLQRQSFACAECENPIATLVSVQQLEIPTSH